jgi:hypothetical protein
VYLGAVAKLPQPSPLTRTEEDDFFEAPTEKRGVPAELLEPPPPVRVTTKLRKGEIEQLLANAREATQRDADADTGEAADDGAASTPPEASAEVKRSGMRPLFTDDATDRFGRREGTETLPAPPDSKTNENDKG